MVGSTPLSMMICPFDVDGHQYPYIGTASNFALAGAPTPFPWAHGNYACNAGGIHQPNGEPTGFSSLGWLSSQKGQTPLYASNASFGGPVPDGTPLGGVMCINWGARFADITDGSSNTILLNEVRTGQFITPTDRAGCGRSACPAPASPRATPVGIAPPPTTIMPNPTIWTALKTKAFPTWAIVRAVLSNKPRPVINIRP